MIKKILLGIIILFLIVFIVIQFFQPEKNYSDITEESIMYHLEIPEIVKKKLVASCYDCHSNQTRYPWYSKIAPVSWLLDSHIREGKENLNFSEWNSYSTRKQIGLLDEICEVLSDGSMPPEGYIKMHREAIFNEKEIQDICEWAEEAAENILTK